MGSALTSAAYSPDGQQILTGSEEKISKVWDANTGQELLTLSGHIDRVLSVGYSPDGRRIVTASKDKTIRLYTTNIDELLSIAKSRVTRQFTEKERKRYGLSD